MGAVAAHEGENLTPSNFLHHWNTDPLVLMCLLAATWLYSRGVINLWRRVGRGRGVRGWQVGCFWVGILMLFVALISPIDLLGAQLFSAHMLQHMLLVAAAAPLLALAAPLVGLLWAFPAQRKFFGQFSRLPAVRFAASVTGAPMPVWLLHISALWLWHIPALYEAALTHPLIHSIEHASFFGTAFLFWWQVFHARPIGTAVLALFTMMIANGVLGALITFASSAWYPAYAASVSAWHLTPLEDQQLAGVIMWLPLGVVYLAATLLRIADFLKETAISDARHASANDRLA